MRKTFYLNIPRPCFESWEQMEQVGEQKNCSKCDRLLTDFSGMTDPELVQWFEQHPGKSCGRFRSDQLDRMIYGKELPELKSNSTWKWLLAAASAWLPFYGKAQVRSDWDRTDSIQCTLDQYTAVDLAERKSNDSYVLQQPLTAEKFRFYIELEGLWVRKVYRNGLSFLENGKPISGLALKQIGRRKFEVIGDTALLNKKIYISYTNSLGGSHSAVGGDAFMMVSDKIYIIRIRSEEIRRRYVMGVTDF